MASKKFIKVSSSPEAVRLFDKDVDVHGEVFTHKLNVNIVLLGVGDSGYLVQVRNKRKKHVPLIQSLILKVPDPNLPEEIRVSMMMPKINAYKTDILGKTSIDEEDRCLQFAHSIVNVVLTDSFFRFR